MGFYSRGIIRYVLEYVPGFALLAFLAVVARVLGLHVADSYCALYAILLGILVRNLFGLSALFEPGTRTYEVFWKIGIVLLGSQMGLHSFRVVGFRGVALAGLEVVAAIALTIWLTGLFKITAPLRYLLAVGLGICGVSAVIALAAVTESDEEDTSYAVSVILVFGLMTLALLPTLGHLMRLSDFHFGLWAGLSVDNTAEAVATGFTFSEAAGHYATLAKLCRNMFLGVAVMYFLQEVIRRKIADGGVSKIGILARYFPKFAIGLTLFSGLATVRFWSPSALITLNHLYRWAFLLGFSGVGLRTDLRRLRVRGLRPLALAMGVQALTVVAMLGCVLIAF